MTFAWMSNPQYLAQVGHFLGGAWIVFLCGLFGGETVMLWGLAAGLAMAALKEFVFDVAPWGEGDSWTDSAMDFAFYALGGVAGLGMFALASHAHRLVAA